MKQPSIWLPLALLSCSALWSGNLSAADNQLKWQVTPYFGYSSSLDFDSEEAGNITGKEHQNWGFFISKETP